MGKKIPLEDKGKQDLKKELDAIFSYWVRLIWSTSDGYCTCITCGERVFWLYIQNGHYLSRIYLITRFEPDNCRPQCQSCNWAQSANKGGSKQLDFEDALVEELGEERVKEIKKLRDITNTQYDTQWYIEKIKHYEGEVAKLLLTRPAKLYT